FIYFLVTNHRRRYEAFLEQLLEGFSLRHATEITRIPKSIRQIKLKEFDLYGGNVQACVQAITRQRMAENDGEGQSKKRKWQAALLEQSEEERASKTPRLVPASPTKGGPKRALFPKTPTRNIPAPSRTALPPGAKLPPREQSPSKSRPASPVKHSTTTSQFKPPTTGFNPVLPPKTPTYPRRHARYNESVLSVNGTPLALPRSHPDNDDTTKDTRAGFVIKRDPTYNHNPSYSMASSASTSTAVSNSSSGSGALITVATHKGEMIQFDPLLTSPGTLERMPDLTDSAKKQVRDDTARIVQALAKWRL
ncbi:hypothetical protein M408DRAFT_125196, partial [Serendipita vermifera MAFF 305830]